VGEMALRGKAIPLGLSGGCIVAWLLALGWWRSGTLWHYSVLTTLSGLLVAAVVSMEGQHKGRVPRWLWMLGNASYALYLIHPLLVPVFEWLIVRIGRKVVLGWPAFVLEVALGCCAAIAVHLILEKPLLNSINQALGMKWPVLRV
jgi:exopolysaccharide production protein ExoZ